MTELVLRKGTSDDIASVVGCALLVDVPPNLILLAELRQAWQPLIDRGHTRVVEAM